MRRDLRRPRPLGPGPDPECPPGPAHPTGARCDAWPWAGRHGRLHPLHQPDPGPGPPLQVSQVPFRVPALGHPEKKEGSPGETGRSRRAQSGARTPPHPSFSGGGPSQACHSPPEASDWNSELSLSANFAPGMVASASPWHAAGQFFCFGFFVLFVCFMHRLKIALVPSWPCWRYCVGNNVVNCKIKPVGKNPWEKTPCASKIHAVLLHESEIVPAVPILVRPVSIKII